MKLLTSPSVRITLTILLGLSLFFSCKPNVTEIDTDKDKTENILYVHGQDGSDSNLGTKTSPLETIQAAIELSVSFQPPKKVLVAAGTYSADYRVSGVPPVLLKEGVELYGGYSDTDWDSRDPDIHVTVIEDASVSGGTTSDPNRAVTAETGVSLATVVDGFTIIGGGGDISFAVFLKDASPQLVNCVIDGGDGLSYSAGIYNLNASSPTIERNIISGGNGDVAFGVYNYTDCAPIIEGNRIGGAGFGSQSIGIYNDALCPSVIRNNLIDGGSGAYSLGIMVVDALPIIRNNTISGGSSTTDWTVAVATDGTAQPMFQNNIVFAVAGLGRVGFYEFGPSGDPLSFQNNDIFDCPNGLYFDADGNGLLTTAAALNDYTLTTQDLSNLSQDNISDNPLFFDIDGADDDLITLEDNDWRLSASSPTSVISGGLNGAHSTASWGFSTDKSGGQRSPLDDTSLTGWSIGAYEDGAASSGKAAIMTARLLETKDSTTTESTGLSPNPPRVFRSY